MTKGDTLKATLTITASDGTIYVPEADDVIRFAMKHDYDDTSVIVTKTIPHDTMLLHLEPSDTHTLEVDDYVYDIQITHTNGDVDTFIDRARITLTEEVD